MQLQHHVGTFHVDLLGVCEPDKFRAIMDCLTRWEFVVAQRLLTFQPRTRLQGLSAPALLPPVVEEEVNEDDMLLFMAHDDVDLDVNIDLDEEAHITAQDLIGLRAFLVVWRSTLLTWLLWWIKALRL